MRTIGFKVDDVVRQSIDDADVLIADVTYPNANVFYEIGYAIAREKPVIPTVNIATERAVQRVQQIGLLDTTGWATYENAIQLSELVRAWPNRAWTSGYTRKRNHSHPLFILDAIAKTDFRNWIFSAVENSGVQFRSFDPTQNPRLSTLAAIAEASSSAGMIVPLLGGETVDAERHNIRASFLLGLAHGYGVAFLAIQYDHSPTALDYRDFVTNSTYRHETENHVTKFSTDVLVLNQKSFRRDELISSNILNLIDLGSPTAENETESLRSYFVQTAEFARALRSEGAVVVGRKGSGKSAIQLQAVAHLAADKRNCVVDLRPASHHLSEMREALLSVVSAGVFDHTIAAFWQYVIYFEVMLRLREMVLAKARNNISLQEKVSKLEDKFSLNSSVVSGDFTSRLESAVRMVIAATRNSEIRTDLKNRLTNAMFERPIPDLREAVVSFYEFVQDVIVLVDDIDKGWPARKVEAHDVTTVRHLIEALNRIRRDLGKRRVGLRHLIFLRSDVYERLVEQTSDRGKYNVINVDWSDPEQLRYLLRRRVDTSFPEADREAAWSALNPLLPNGRDAVDTLIEGSLRRPRFLIDVAERALSFAINRGHSLVGDGDVEEGLKEMSLYLVSDFAYEMRDTAGTPEDIFYRFIGKGELLTEEELKGILKSDTLGLEVEELIELLLWYGFLGVINSLGDSVFIYDRGYDIRRLEAERNSEANESLFSVNPAFLRGLKR